MVDQPLNSIPMTGDELLTRANTTEIDPVKAGEYKRIADKFQVGTEFVAQNSDYYKTLDKNFGSAAEYGDFAVAAPHAASWFVQDAAHTAAAKNNLKYLNKLESFRQGTMAREDLGYGTAIGHGLAQAGLFALKLPVGAAAGISYGLQRLAGARESDIVGTEGHNPGALGWLTDAAISLEKTSRSIRDSESPYGKTLGQEIVGVAAESLPNVLTTGAPILAARIVGTAASAAVRLTAASLVAAETSAIQSFGDNLSQKQQETGSTTIDARLVSQALINGAITGISTKLGGLTGELRFAHKSLRISNAAQAIKEFGIDVASEGGEEAAQQIVDNIYNDRSIFSGVLKAGFIGGAAAAPVHLAHIPGLFAREAVQNVVMPAAQAAIAIDNTSTLAGIVAVGQNDPTLVNLKDAPIESKISYFDNALKGTDLETVSIPKAEWDAYWSSVPGVTPEQMSASVGATQSGEDIEAGDIRVKTSTLIARTYNTPHIDHLLDMVVTDGAGISFKQAVENAKELPSLLEESSKRADDLMKNPTLSDGTPDDHVQIEEHLTEQFQDAERGTGQGSSTRAKRNARLTALSYRSLADSLNRGGKLTSPITPKQLFDKFPVKALRLKKIDTAAEATNAINGESTALSQGDAKGINIGQTVATLKDADASTLAHELSHSYLNVVFGLRSQGLLAEDTNNSLDEANAWFAGNLHQAKQADIDAVRAAAKEAGMETDAFYKQELAKLGTKDQPHESVFRVAHELFAEGYTTWLKEGKAPTRSLRNMFAQFAEWLMNLVGSGVQISEDMRKVYGRMITIKEDIEKDQAISDSYPKTIAAQKPESMPQSVWNWLVRNTVDARTKAVELYRSRQNHMEQAEAHADYAEKKAIAVEEAKKDVAARKPYVAMASIKGEQLHPDIPIKTAQKTLISAESLPQETDNDKTIAEVLRLRGLTSTEPDASHVKDVATQLGYTDSEDMITDLFEMAPFDQAVDDEAESRLMKEYGVVDSSEPLFQQETDAVNLGEAQAELAVILADRFQKSRSKGLIAKEVSKEQAAKIKERMKGLIEKAKQKGEDAVADIKAKMDAILSEIEAVYKAEVGDAKIFQQKAISDIKELVNTKVTDDVIEYRLSQEDGGVSQFTDKAARLSESATVKAAKNDYRGAADDLFQSAIYNKMAKAAGRELVSKSTREKKWLEAYLEHEIDTQSKENKLDRAQVISLFRDQLKDASKTGNAAIKSALEHIVRISEETEVKYTKGYVAVELDKMRVKAVAHVFSMPMTSVNPSSIKARKSLAAQSASKARRIEQRANGDLFGEFGDLIMHERRLQIWNELVAQEMQKTLAKNVSDIRYLKKITKPDSLNTIARGGVWTVLAPDGTMQGFGGVDGEAKAKQAYEAAGGDQTGHRLYRSSNMRTQLESVLAPYDIIPASARTVAGNQAIRSGNAQGPLPARKSVTELDVDEFKALVDHVLAIETAAKEQEVLTNTGRDTNLEKWAEDVRSNHLPGVKASVFDKKTANMFEKTLDGLGEVILSAQRLTTFIRWLDGGKSDGPFATVLYYPFRKASGHYDRIVDRALSAVFEAKNAMKDYNRRANDKVEVVGVGRMLRSDMWTAAMLHGSNEGRNRLIIHERLDKDGKTVRSGKYTQEQVDAILLAVDNDEDVKFINDLQKMHDEVLRPEIADAKSREGIKSVKWREAMPTSLPSGRTLRGGYATLTYTTTPINTFTLDQFGDYVKAGAARPSDSYTMNVAENVDPSLEIDLSFDRQMSHIETVARDVAFREYAVNASKVIEEIKHDINQKFGHSTASDLTKQISHVVLGNPAAESAWESGLSNARRNIAAFRIMGNLWTATQQLTGLSNATAHKDVSTAALFRSATNAMGGLKSMYELMCALDPSMKSRHKKYNYEFQEAMLALQGRSAKVQKAGDILSTPMRWSQGLVDTITWHAAYQGALKKFNGDNAKAVEQASRVVEETQGSGSVESVPVAFRSQIARAMTLFGSYKITQLNQMISAYRDFNVERDGKSLMNAAHATAAIMIMPAIATWLLGSMLRGGVGPEDDDTEGHPWARWMAKQMAGEFIGLVPVVGSLAASSIQNPHFATGLAVLSPLSEVGDVFNKAISKDPTFDAKSFYNLMPAFFFIPAGGQLGNMYNWSSSYMDGKIPTSALSFGLLFGGPLKEAENKTKK